MEDEWDFEDDGVYEEGEELHYDDQGTFGVDPPFVESPAATDQ